MSYFLYLATFYCTLWLLLNDTVLYDFPNGSSGKESTCQCSRCRFDPWVGKIPWSRKWLPAPVFLPGKSHGQRSLAGYSPKGCKESDMTKHKEVSPIFLCPWMETRIYDTFPHTCPHSRSKDWFQGRSRELKAGLPWALCLSRSHTPEEMAWPLPAKRTQQWCERLPESHHLCPWCGRPGPGEAALHLGTFLTLAASVGDRPPGPPGSRCSSHAFLWSLCYFQVARPQPKQAQGWGSRVWWPVTYL